ncbi:hypothetical protein EJ06DRAFT_560439 [Trichodelitschia bisporula]|uniref:Bud emergence protein 1 n=1 Tax=Trichodelitschia bisporula TaxID=703511 RepID=A0A6G1HIR7_9PEZI|nr:hypothetical protein EJ06DRAFT_560439 [Trichodelitschia bisporula]
MVKFRMSMKSDKGDTKPHHHSIPPKDAIAIVPPKKVIKAIYDYQPVDKTPGSGYLAFSAGDFLHVVGRENDQDWYEACNPLQNTRGLVPVKYFEIVGKQARNSAGSTRSDPSYHPVGSHTSAPHDSGYADSSTTMSSPGNGAGGSIDTKSGRRLTGASARGANGGSGQGSMVYGVVMYDFKAERPDELDAKEGEAIIVIAQSNPEWFVAKPITRLGGPGLIPVSFIEIRDMTTGQPVPDPYEAVRAAGVPRVEEWKKMAADYKNGSIPLGTLGGGSGGQSASRQQSAMAGMQQGMARMSVGNQSQTAYDSGMGYARQPQKSSYTSAPYSKKPSPAPVRASVPRYCFSDDIFWFIVEAEMEDGKHWELQRLYQDFYDLQIKLIQEFPLEAGNVEGYERSLPYMPGPVTYVTDNISNGRRANLDEYIRSLLKLGEHITRGNTLKAFFAPRQGDYEYDPNQPYDYRLSSGSQDSPAGRSDGVSSPQSSAGNLPSTQQAFQPEQAYPGYGAPRGHTRTASEMTTATMAGLRPGGGTAPGLKIKVFFEQDNCVIIRLPAQFRYSDLYKKLKERRALEKLSGPGDDPDLEVLWKRDDGQVMRLESDDDLGVALENTNRLTLSVKPR